MRMHWVHDASWSKCLQLYSLCVAIWFATLKYVQRFCDLTRIMEKFLISMCHVTWKTVRELKDHVTALRLGETICLSHGLYNAWEISACCLLNCELWSSRQEIVREVGKRMKIGKLPLLAGDLEGLQECPSISGWLVYDCSKRLDEFARFCDSHQRKSAVIIVDSWQRSVQGQIHSIDYLNFTSTLFTKCGLNGTTWPQNPLYPGMLPQKDSHWKGYSILWACLIDAISA